MENLVLNKMENHDVIENGEIYNKSRFPLLVPVILLDLYLIGKFRHNSRSK